MEGTINPSIFFDFCCLVLVVVTAVRFARKGLLASIVECAGTLGSLLFARLFSGWAAPQIFQSWFAPGLYQKVAQQLASGGTANLDGLLAQFEGFLPESVVQSVLEPVHTELEQAFTVNLDVVADKLMHQLLEPLLIPIVMAVLFFLSFVLLRMVVSLLSGMLIHVNGIPLIGAANKSLGFVAGAAVGVLYLFLLLCALWVLINITGGRLPVLNDTLLTGSLLYRIFSAVNPFVV